MSEVITDSRDSYIELEQLGDARNQVMLIMAEFRDTDFDLANNIPRLDAAIADYSMAALFALSNEDDPIAWMCGEAVERRRGMKLLGYDIDAELTDEGYKAKYRGYLEKDVDDESPFTIADFLVKDLHGERDMLYWFINKSQFGNHS